MEKLAPAAAVPIGWRPLGPYAIPHGQTYGSGPGSRPAVAGRISSIAIDPGDADHILVGSGGGGVWETRDGGATWRPLTDDQPALATGAIAFAPSDQTRIYIGTGEGDFFASLGVGILRSADGGGTWNLVGSTDLSGVGCYEIAVNPLNADRIVVATRAGLYTSTNGGTVLNRVRTARTWDVSIQAPTAGASQTTLEALAGCNDGVYRSTDSGATWAAVSLPGATGAWERIEVCHAPSDPNVAYVFASVGGAVQIWRRNILGGAFIAVPSPGGLSTAQAWYDWFAGVAPNDPNVLYVGGIDAFRGDFAGGTWSWSPISAKTTGDSIHPDQHAIAFSPVDAAVVYIGNDGGVYRSPDRGTSWRSLNKGLCITEIEYLAQNPMQEAYLIAGTQDNGTLRYEGEEVWYHVQDGDGGDCGVSQTAPSTCLHSFYGLGLERSTTGGGWGSWTWLGLPTNATDSSLFYPPMEVDGTTVIQAGNRAFLSRDTGTTWAAVALPGGDVASALTTRTGDVVYVGSYTGQIYRIDFVGGAWTAPTTLTRPRTGWCSDVQADSTNPNRLWAAFSTVAGSHVYRSDNGGSAWTDISAGLPAIPANSIALDPMNPNTVWVALDVGVFRSTDAGATWASFNNHLPNALAKDLVLHPASRLLRVGMQNRGVWEIDVDAPVMDDVQIYLRDSAVDTGRRTPSPSGVVNPFNPGFLTHWWQSVDIKIDSQPFQTPIAGDVDFQRFEDDHGVFTAGLLDEGGHVLRNRLARVFVEVHNRGPVAATNVAVKVFFADASLGLANLPGGFWANFPNNVLPAASQWQAIAPALTIASVTAERPQVAAFEWLVPATAAGHSCLLAIITAGNDSIGTTELNIGALVTSNRRCGLKNLAVVNPPAVEPIRALPLWIWGPEEAEFVNVGLERFRRNFAIGVVLSRRLAEIARNSRWTKTEIDEGAQKALKELLDSDERLYELLDRTIFAPPKGGRWFDRLRIPVGEPEMIVLLLPEGQRPPGSVSLIQTDHKRQVIGGYTLEWR